MKASAIVTTICIGSVFSALALLAFGPGETNTVTKESVETSAKLTVEDQTNAEKSSTEESKIAPPVTNNNKTDVQETLDSIEILSPFPKAIELSLADEISVEVTFKLDDFATLNALLSRVARREHLFDTLSQASEAGIASANLEVYRLLRDCNDLKKHPEKFNPYQSEHISAACRNISQHQIDNRQKWIDKGVEQSDFGALSKVAFENRGIDSDKAYDLYHRAWESGHTGTTLAISSLLREGVPSINGGEPDLIRSYAFALIHASIEKAAMSMGGRAIDPNIETQIDQYMAVQSARLDLNQLAESQRLAQQLLTNNRNCCVNLWENYRN